jgi:carbonic anhydrase
MIAKKTRYLLFSLAAIVMFVLPGLVFAACPPGQLDINSVCAKPTPEQAIEALKEGNLSYTSGNVSLLKSLSTPSVRSYLNTNGQAPYAVVLTCSDSRVPPEILFDKGLGEIFTVRVAGNVVAPHELGSIEYAVEHLGAQLIVVLGHERCGAVKTTYDVHGTDHSALGDNLNSLISSIDPAVTAVLAKSGGKASGASEQATQVEECVAENAKMVTESLEILSPILKEKVELGELKIVQAKYDLDDGAVTFSSVITPGIISYPTVSSTGIYAVSWSAIVGATEYYLEESTDNGVTWGTAEIVKTNSRTYSGKTNGTYKYRVKTGKTGYVDSGYTTGGTLTITLETIANAPGNIFYPATNTTGSYIVNWSAIVGASAYVLEESTNNGVSWGNAVTVGTNSITFNGKTSGSYMYRVKTRKTGLTDSVWRTGGTLTVTLPTIANAPGNIFYPATDATGSYVVNWSAVMGASAYVLEESTNNGVSWGNAVTVGSNSITFNGKTSGTYMYRVKARKTGLADSVWRTGGTLTVTLPTIANAPGNIFYPATDATGSYVVNWSAVMGASAYVLEESTNNGVSWGNAVTVDSNSITFNGKTSGSYMYRVKTRKTGLTDSVWRTGGILTVTLPTIANAPGNILYAAANTTGSYTVNWSAIMGATAYVLEESTNSGVSWGNAVTVGTTSFPFSGKANGTYMYRVKTRKTGLTDSVWRTGGLLVVTR